MLKKKFFWWIPAALILLLVMLTGCQTVQGLNIVQAFKNSASITTVSSKSSLQVELIPGDASSLTSEQKSILELFNKVKIDITNATVQDSRNVSLEGAFTYTKGSIPFKLTVQDMNYVIQIDGAPKPIVLNPVTPLNNGAAYTTFLMPLSVQNQLQDSVQKFQPTFIQFILGNAPFPKNISVNTVSEPINNETLSLQKAHIELDGAEFADILKTFLQNVAADDKGLKELISQLYDVLLPVMEEQAKNSSVELPEIMKNKTFAVSLAYGYVQKALEEAITNFDQVVGNDSPAQAFLSKQTTLKADFFVDKDEQIRKQNFELYLPIADSSSGLAAVQFTYSSEIWDINKPVKADSIDLSGGTLNVGPETSTYSFMSQLNKQSQLYKLLKDDLKMTKKEVYLVLIQADEEGWQEGGQPFINEDGVMMAPIRFISKQLGYGIKWNNELQQTTIQDELTGKTVVLTLGDKTALVNGSPVELESAPVLHSGSSFAPIGFIAEQFGCKVEFNADTSIVTIKRD